MPPPVFTQRPSTDERRLRTLPRLHDDHETICPCHPPAPESPGLFANEYDLLHRPSNRESRSTTNLPLDPHACKHSSNCELHLVDESSIAKLHDNLLRYSRMDRHRAGSSMCRVQNHSSPNPWVNPIQRDKGAPFPLRSNTISAGYIRATKLTPVTPEVSRPGLDMVRRVPAPGSRLHLLASLSSLLLLFPQTPPFPESPSCATSINCTAAQCAPLLRPCRLAFQLTSLTTIYS
jgi:hypothetical protein